MRSIWIVNHYAGGPGIGTGWRHWELGRRWAAAGIEVRVFTASTSIGGAADPARQGAREIDGVGFVFVDTPAYRGNGVGRLRNILGFNRRLAAVLSSQARNDGSPDLLIASSPQPFAWRAAGRFARSTGAAFVPEIRDLWPESLVQLGGLPPWHPLVLWCSLTARKAYRSADAVASTLPGIADALAEHEVPPSRCIVIPNGTDLGDRKRGAIPEELERVLMDAERAGRSVLLYAGALGVPNAMDQLLDAIALLRPDRRQRLRCLIIGAGTERQHLEDRAGKIPGNVVHFAGPLPQETVRSIIPRCNAGFQGWLDLPLYRHGTSAQKLSMMLGEGLPVVHAAPMGPDPVREHGLGWACAAQRPDELARALERMLDSTRSETTCLSRRCREFARERFDWDGIASRALVDLKALANPGRNRVSR